MSITTQDIVSAIINGEVDNGRSAIAEALKSRARALDALKHSELEAKDRVVFNRSARPKYMLGVGAEVVDKNQTTVILNIDRNPRARQRSGQKNVRCPVGYVDKVKAPVVA